MGIVIQFRHRASSSGVRTPKTDGSARKSKRLRAEDTTNISSAGIRPLDLQFQTAVGPTPDSSAAACTPPSASITCVTELSMTHNILTIGEKVKPHPKRLAPAMRSGDNPPMDSRDQIAKRLLAFQATTKFSGPEICEKIGAKANSWIQWTSEKYTRIIPKTYASKLCIKFELTLDWIYRGLPVSRVPDHIRDSDLAAPAPKRRRVKRKTILTAGEAEGLTSHKR